MQRQNSRRKIIMRLQSFFLLVFFTCLSIASTEPVSAFPKSTTPSRKINRHNGSASTASTSATSTFNSENEQVFSGTVNSDLSDIILKTNGGSTAFPPPIRSIGLSTAIEKGEEEGRRQVEAKRQFFSKHKSTILAVFLMGFTGVVESICYRHFKMYPNMMTGNTVRAMDAITSLRWDEIRLCLGVIGSYISGGTLFKFLDRARVFSSKRIPTMAWLSAISFAFFGLSDVVNMMSTGFDLMRLLPMATAFGMINCATQQITGGYVTNAATGHYGKIGFGLGEAIVMNVLPGGREDADRQTIKLGITSALAIGSFVTTLITTNLIGLWLDAKHPWVYAKLPPLGLSLGAAYTILFTIYHYFSKKSEKYL